MKHKQKDPLKEKFWSTIYKFFIHVLVGTFIFLIIAIPAVSISFLVQQLEKMGADIFICWILKIFEYLLLVADVITYMIYLLSKIKNLLREL